MRDWVSENILALVSKPGLGAERREEVCNRPTLARSAERSIELSLPSYLPIEPVSVPLSPFSLPKQVLIPVLVTCAILIETVLPSLAVAAPECQIVRSIRKVRLATPKLVYNLAVKGGETFFVSSKDLLVHNCSKKLKSVQVLAGTDENGKHVFWVGYGGLDGKPVETLSEWNYFRETWIKYRETSMITWEGAEKACEARGISFVDLRDDQYFNLLDSRPKEEVYYLLDDYCKELSPAEKDMLKFRLDAD